MNASEGVGIVLVESTLNYITDSSTRGKWEEYEYISRIAPSGWKEKHDQKTDSEDYLPDIKECPPAERERESVWVRLMKKVYVVDPLVCPRCGSEMKILAIIFDPEEIKKILTHLAKIGRSPPDFDPASLNK